MTALQPLVVGIGASAGGIPALEGFFRSLDDECGMAFVIVTHLSPDRKSMLDRIVARYTRMPVLTATDGLRVEPEHVYVMPEGRFMTIRDGALWLHEDDPVRRERKPVDVFFAALAEDQGDHAVGIVLSGGDSDGTLGVRFIKEHGGVTLAQGRDGSAPANPEMPENARASGGIDFFEPVEQMPARLMQIRRDAVTPAPLDHEQEASAQVQQEIAKILRSRTGRDFSGYKAKTFLRRVARRMKVVGCATPETYLQRLHDEPGETAELFRDLLINVTGFFRDAEAFEALRTQVIARLLDGRGADEAIRIWVPGCATGEEVYSLGILLHEALNDIAHPPRVQLFATDIDEDALTVARAGRFPAQLLTGVSPERRQRFFRKDGAAFVICKEVRDMCIFSPHSVIGDPPFSRMDLVSCRNLLIYMDAGLQDQVIPTFHYALKPGGYLFLGSAEGVSRHAHLFGPIDKRSRIFQSRGHDGAPRRLPMSVEGMALNHTASPHSRRIIATADRPLRKLVEAQVLDRHAPAHVVVTTEGEITFYSSNTGRYLEAPRGAPNRDLIDMARRELRIDLRAALRQSQKTLRPAMRQVLMLENEGHDGFLVEIVVEPLETSLSSEPLFLVLFKYLSEAQPLLEQIEEAAPDEAQEAVERELRELRERLQSIIEEYETALEELKSSNEELVSVNEEAQSTNEELEASKEEMQSLNEELTTINGELSSSVEELDRANSDLQNLYAATQVATIFMDGKLVIRNFTPAASAFFNLRDSDVGRPLTDLASHLDFPGLEARVREVFQTGEGFEQRLSAQRNDQSYLVRLMPYRDHGEGIGGVVVTIVDVSTLAMAERLQRKLFTELNDRVRDLLAAAIDMTGGARHGAASLDAFADDLTKRLHGMARTCELLIETGWTTVPIDALVKTGLVEIDPARVEMTGEEIRLRPRQALQLGLILNELAFEAGRGGVREGEAPVIAWRLEEGWMTLEWQERGGSSTGMARRIEALATRIIALGGLGEIRDTAEGPLFALRLPLET